MEATTTSLQDHNTIVRAFERGANFTQTEPAVFAPLSRGVQNTKYVAKSVQKVLKSTKLRPTQKEKTQKEGERFGTNSTFAARPSSEGFSLSMEQQLRDCLPCADRILDLDFVPPLAAFRDSLLLELSRRLAFLKNIGDLLGNLDGYGDLCGLLGFLNSMCILDLQRMLMILGIFGVDLSINLDGISGLIESLIAPLVSPLFLGLSSLLDTFVQIVLLPIDCIIEALDLVIRDIDVVMATGQTIPEFGRDLAVTTALSPIILGREIGEVSDAVVASVRRRVAGEEIPQSSTTITPAAPNSALERGLIATIEERSRQQEAQGGIRSSLVEMKVSLIRAKARIKEKLEFYTTTIDKLLNRCTSLDLQQTNFALNRLINIRLIGFIVAMIRALATGRPICEQGQTPAREEIDNFINTFLNPNSPFQFELAPDGSVKVREKTAQETAGPVGTEAGLQNRVEVLGLSEDPLLRQLRAPVNVNLRCSMATSPEDLERVNQWMRELNQPA